MILAAVLIAEAFHAGISVGAGIGYDAIGVRAELGSDHFAALAAYGFHVAVHDTLTMDDGNGFAAGVRWYRGVYRGLFASLNASDAWWTERTYYDRARPGDPTRPANLLAARVVAGYRWRGEALFFEIGVGAGFYRKVDPPTCSDLYVDCVPQPRPAPIVHGLLPDIALGTGFDF